MFVCKTCGKSFDFDYRKSRPKSEIKNPLYCSRSCANSRGKMSLETKNKIRNKLKGSLGSGYIDGRACDANKMCTVCNKKLHHNNKSGFCKEHLPIVYKNCSFCKKSISVNNIEKHELSCKENPNSRKFSYDYKRKDKRSGYIYKTINTITGKIYVGKCSSTLKNSKSYLGSGLLLNKSIKKYGKQYFFKEMLEIIEDGDLNERERFWINELKSNNPNIGYNLTNGGDGGALFKGRHHTRETIDKITKSRKLRR